MLKVQTISNAPPEMLEKLRDDFEKEVDEAVDSLWEKNTSESREDSESLFNMMYEQIEQKVSDGEYETPMKLKSELQLLT